MNDSFDNLKERIANKTVKIAVVGLGYVGLPLAIRFVEEGFSVYGIDLDKDRIESIKREHSYITDVSDENLGASLKSGRFKVSRDFRIIRDTQVIIICVPTPLKRKYSPDISYIKEAVVSIAKNIRRPSLVVLESTTYPGTTEEVILPLFNKNCKFINSENLYLCFSPERIDPGNKIYSLKNIPKIIGGINPQATELGLLLYRSIIKKVLPASCARTAEFVKLLENTFRLVNIGLVYELTMMSYKMNIDIWEAIKLASTKPFGFMPFFPGPGVGGHCIPKDPLYLYWKAKKIGFDSKFIRLASKITSYMPYYIVERVVNLLKNKKKKWEVLIIGVTYKKDVKDLRKSPVLDIIEILQKNDIKVAYYDPLIPYLKINNINLKASELKKEILNKFDCVIIATDHSNIDYKFILDNSSLIFDTRNVYRGIDDRRIVRL
ncbi:MAG: nucleotide sugar dehydrogenase [Candidatus Omnitrophica bacterium]|nr:nucleotide sugar dehydrogenase [Candidatus Omnitrophota bacterium]